MQAEVLTAIHLEPGSGVPLHRQIEDALRRLIQSGRFQPGNLIPGEVALTTHLGVSRHTVRHALGVLEAEGLVARKAGVGTAVAPAHEPAPIVVSLAQFYAFSWEVRARGGEHRSYVLSRHAEPADAAVATRLEIEQGSTVERIERLRTADGEALVIETTHIPAELADGIDQETLERGTVYDALERRLGLPITGATETIRPIILDGRSAGLLTVAEGSPAFLVDRRTWSGQRTVEWQRSIVRGDRFLFSAELPRGREDRRA